MSNLAVVEQVKYPYHAIINHDDITGEDKVLVVVHMPSGQYSDKMEVNIHDGGRKMSIYEVYPKGILNTNFIMKQSRIDANSSEARAFGNFIQKNFFASSTASL